MTKRLQILGVLVALAGLGFLAVGGFVFLKTQEGYRSLQAFSAAQNVNLTYNEDGQLVDRGETAEAQAIMSLLRDDWGYAVADGDLNPNDPLVNTPSEYMYQMATIAYHVLHGTQTIVLTEDVEYNGEVFPAGEYEFAVDGRYYADFDRSHPLEGPARGLAWSPTALGLIGQLGVGTTTGSALQLGLAISALFAGVGAVTLLIGVGLMWAIAARKKEEVAALVAVPKPMPA